MDLIYEGITTIFNEQFITLLNVRMDLIYEGITTDEEHSIKFLYSSEWT